MRKTLEQAHREATDLFARLPLPGEAFSRAVRDTWQQLTTRGQPARRWGVLVEIGTPQGPLEKLSARIKVTRLGLRHQFVTRLYRRLPPLYAVCLAKPNPEDLWLHRDKLAYCVEAERLEREAISRELREAYPSLSTAWSEDTTLEDEIQALWEQFLEACHDRYFFPVRSRLQNRGYLIDVSAEAGVHATGVSYADRYIDGAQARAQLGREVALIRIPVKH